MSLANIPANRVHQKWMLERMKDLISPQDNKTPIGILLKADFLRVAKELKENGFIKDIPEFESFYRKCSVHAEK